MEFAVKTTQLSKAETDLLVLFTPLFSKLPAFISELDVSLTGDIAFSLPKEKFTGKRDQKLVLFTRGKIASYKILMYGLGQEKKLTIYEIKKAIASTIKVAKESKVKRLGLAVPDVWFSLFAHEDIGQAISEGAILGNYNFAKYKGSETVSEQTEIEEIFVFSRPQRLTVLENGIKQGKIFAISTNYARDLVNEPSAVTTPTYLATKAKDIEKNSHNKIKVSIYDKDEIQKQGMNAFLGVSRGSSEPPKFIKLHYKPLHSKKRIIIIGKGITFDTGGLSLKPAEHMETMKLDMAGAASVLGIFQGLTNMSLNVEVIGLIAACENMPSGSALKPGDILKAKNGKTIEVLNTDAEGRLTLSDMLSYAVLEKPNAIIDMATLTGACMVALGENIAGLWSNDDSLASDIERSAQKAGEKVWKMPLEEEYKSLIKSHIADIKNIQTGRYGGAITAALFLHEFVGNTPWAHLDIAGPAYEERNNPLIPKGGSGFGVVTILEYLLGL